MRCAYFRTVEATNTPFLEIEIIYMRLVDVLGSTDTVYNSTLQGESEGESPLTTMPATRGTHASCTHLTPQFKPISETWGLGKLLDPD